MKGLLEFKLNFNIKFYVEDQGKIVFNKPEQKITVFKESVMPGFKLSQLKCKAFYNNKVEDVVRESSYALAKNIDLHSLKTEAGKNLLDKNGKRKAQNQQSTQDPQNNQNPQQGNQNQQQNPQQSNQQPKQDPQGNQENQRMRENPNDNNEEAEEEPENSNGAPVIQPKYRNRDIAAEYAGLSYTITGEKILVSIPFDVNDGDKETHTYLQPSMVTDKQSNVKNVTIDINGNIISNNQAIKFLQQIFPYVSIDINFAEQISFSNKDKQREKEEIESGGTQK
jgi:Ca-activated chloride channel family protein